MPAQEAIATLVSVLVFQAKVAEAEQHVRSRLHEGSLQSKLVGKPLVVGIVEGYQRVARFGDPTVTGRSEPAMLPQHIPNSITIGLEDLFGVVGGSVIHDYDLVAGDGRRQNGV